MATYTQHFQGHPEGLPKGFFIERQGEIYITTYCVTTQEELGGVLGTHHRYRRFTTEHNRAANFETLEEAQAFIHGFVAFLQWMSGFAASTPDTKMAA